MAYAEKLKDPKWQKKRLQILERDSWTCKNCLSTENTLHVHHKRYLKGKDPWDYEDCFLVTLCEHCHQLEPEMMEEAIHDLLLVLKELFLAREINEITNAFIKNPNLLELIKNG